MSEKCPTCGSPVEVKGHTTHYYVSENEYLRTEIAQLKEKLGRAVDVLEKIASSEAWRGSAVFDYPAIASEALAAMGDE